MTDNNDCEIIVCAGPPECPFTDDEAVENARNGCPLCKRTIYHADGSETEYQRKAN